MLHLIQLLLFFDPAHFTAGEVAGSTYLQVPTSNMFAPIDQAQNKGQPKTTEAERDGRRGFT